MPLPFHERIIEARGRVNPDGIIASGAFAVASSAAIVPMEAGFTYIVHEIAKEPRPDFLRFAAIGALGVANAVSIGVESKAFQEKGYSSSPAGNLANVLTGRPLFSSAAEHGYNLVQVSVINPINYLALINNDWALFAESVGSTSLALTIWLTATNTLIRQGRADPVVNKIREVRQAIVNKIRRNKSSESSTNSENNVE